MLTEGQMAPDFDVQNDEGQSVKLSDFRGHWVVLYFYPKAMTSGCTLQAQDLRDDFPSYQGKDVVILASSPDPVKDLVKFKEKESLPFTLLSDPEHAMAEAYNVWVEKKMYGRVYWGNERSTFIIDPEGKIARIFRKVKPKEHNQLVQDVLTELGA